MGGEFGAIENIKDNHYAPEPTVPQTEAKWKYSITDYYSIREATVLQTDARGRSLIETGKPLQLLVYMSKLKRSYPQMGLKQYPESLASLEKILPVQNKTIKLGEVDDFSNAELQTR